MLRQEDSVKLSASVDDRLGYHHPMWGAIGVIVESDEEGALVNFGRGTEYVPRAWLEPYDLDRLADD